MAAIAEQRAAMDPGRELRWLADAYEATQRLRIAIGNRMDATAREADLGPVPSAIAAMYVPLRAFERRLQREMDRHLAEHPAWPWLSAVKGIGPTLGAKVLGLIGDIARYDTVSKLWRVAGYAVINGHAERMRGGEKAHYSKRLKTALYLCGVSFVRCRSEPYRTVFDRAKARYQERAAQAAAEERWTKAHIDNAARRVAVKLFLAHLWEQWRMAVGMPVRPPYVAEYLGHTSIIPSSAATRAQGRATRRRRQPS